MSADHRLKAARVITFPQTTKSTRLTPQGFSARPLDQQKRSPPLSFVNRNWYLKGSSEAAPPVPFPTLDYVLCAVEFFLWASPLTQTSPRSLLLSTNNRVIR